MLHVIYLLALPVFTQAQTVSPSQQLEQAQATTGQKPVLDAPKANGTPVPETGEHDDVWRRNLDELGQAYRAVDPRYLALRWGAVGRIFEGEGNELGPGEIEKARTVALQGLSDEAWRKVEVAREKLGLEEDRTTRQLFAPISALFIQVLDNPAAAYDAFQKISLSPGFNFAFVKATSHPRQELQEDDLVSLRTYLTQLLSDTQIAPIRKNLAARTFDDSVVEKRIEAYKSLLPQILAYRLVLNDQQKAEIMK